MGNFVPRLSEEVAALRTAAWSTLVPRITGVRPRVNSTTGGFLTFAHVFSSVFLRLGRILRSSAQGCGNGSPNLARDFSLSTFRLLQEFSQPG